jgi:oligopeptide/dipeptide ABC transporter ATP-binding protein
MSRAVLSLRGVEKRYVTRAGLFAPPTTIHAVNGIDLEVRAGETLGLVGESGCGKSTLARLMNRLEPPTAGSVTYAGARPEEARSGAARRDELRAFRRAVQMVFQDPYSSMNPRMSVGRIVREPLDNFRVGSRDFRRARVAELLESVGLDRAAADAYPHEFSGGQRQRMAIARALALDPEVVIADEPVSALDVSVQAQVLNLIVELKRSRNLTLVFVSHDLSVVRHISDRIAVMYLGRIVEIGESEALIAAPRHPYSQALMVAVPPSHPGARRHKRLLTGDIPSAARPPAGCAFHTRCPVAVDRCRSERPPLAAIGGGRSVACFLADKTPLPGPS